MSVLSNSEVSKENTENTLSSSVKKEEEVLTRFGPIYVAPHQKIEFPKGIIGFPDLRLFALANIPGHEADHPFLMLQCLKDQEFCFVVMPMSEETLQKDGFLDINLIQPWMAQLGVQEKNMMVFCIVASEKQKDETILTLNRRAPLIFDKAQKKGWQTILDNPDYALSYPLSDL